MTAPIDIKQLIKAEAKNLGFELCGVTTPDPPQSYPVYEEWLKRGFHAGMDYLATSRARERRADPRKILPEAKSIIVLGMRYPEPEGLNGSSPRDGKGKTAAYAWGLDYHEVIPPRLKTLARFIEKQVGRPVNSLAYTDTGPILERDLAQRAGLGWIGKNSCMIDPRSGSYYLLAELFLDLVLQPDQPVTQDYCGSCTRCIDACPTSCILPNRTIDSQRCISYLTIENKVEIPADLRASIGDWVFGCDVCQQVCPWNIRFSQPVDNSALEPDIANAHPEIKIDLLISSEEFTRRFKHSPISRAKRRGYLRNLTVAAGNSKDPGNLDALIKALLSDPEPLVRGHAAWALGRFADARAEKALATAKESEKDPYVLKEITDSINPNVLP